MDSRLETDRLAQQSRAEAAQRRYNEHIQEAARATEATRKKKELIKALEPLHHYLTDRRNRHYVPSHKDIMYQHMELCVKLKKDQPLRETLQSYRNATHYLDQPLLVDAIEKLLGMAQDKAMECKDTDEAGESARFYLSATKHCLDRLTNSVKLFPEYYAVLQRAFQNSVDFQWRYDFNTYCDYCRKNFNAVMAKEDCKSYFEQKSNVECVLRTKTLQLKTAMELKNWRRTLTSMEEMRSIQINFQKISKPMDVKLFLEYTALQANLFFRVKNPLFHSYCKLRCARICRRMMDRPEGYMNECSEAVLSILCICPSEDEQVGGVVQDRDGDRNKELALAATLGLSARPSRAALALDLTEVSALEKSVLNSAHPEVQELFEVLFNVRTVSACQKAADLFAKICKLLPEPENQRFTKYFPEIHEVAVKSTLKVLSHCFTQVTIDYLLSICAFEGKTYLEAEPVITRAIKNMQTCTVSIDQRKKTVKFVHDPQVGTMRDPLARAVRPSQTYEREFFQTSESPAVNTTDLFDRMARECVRMDQVGYVVRMRVTKAKAREDYAKKMEEERRQAELQRQIQQEKERVEKSRREQNEIIIKKIQEAERVERNKYVVEQMNRRYPGLVIPATVILSPTEELFIESLGNCLSKYKRAVTEMRQQDVRMMDHFERACREIEIPRRQQLDRDQREKVLEENRKRIENQKKQAEANLMQQVQTKQLLEKFRHHRATFERDLADVAAKAATTGKRSEQERLLEQTRRQQEVEAAQVAQEQAAAASSPPAEAPPTKQKWVPKSRK